MLGTSEFPVNYFQSFGLCFVIITTSLQDLLCIFRCRDGMLGTSEFPVNYFTISEVEQCFPDDFGATFLHITGKELVDGQDFFW
jgi:hypothetical protein